MKKNISLRVIYTLAIVIATIFTACSSSTGDDHDHEEEAVGFKVYSATSLGVPDQLIVEQSLSGVTGNFTITGEVSDYTVVFVAEDGDEYVPDLAEHTIDVTATENGENLTITRPADTVPNMDFSLQGVKGSSAKITITLKHQGSAEFVSKALPVTINL